MSKINLGLQNITFRVTADILLSWWKFPSQSPPLRLEVRFFSKSLEAYNYAGRGLQPRP
jgi:hypothetical protein